MGLTRQILIILVVLSPLSIWAQTSSPLSRFSVDYVKGCSPLTINVTDLSGSGVSVYEYEGTSSGTTNLTTYTYNTPGQYYLVQTIQNFFPRQDSLLIQVMDPVSPKFELLNCEGLGTTVLITDNMYDQYEIDFGDLTTITTPAGTPSASHFYASSGTYTITVRGIFTGAFDNCGSTTSSFTTISSINPATISSLQMLVNRDMVLNYSLNQNIFYDIQIAVDNGTTFQKLKSISNQSSADTIKNLNQTRDYCFRIISFDPCAGNTITSNIVCSIDMNTVAMDGLNEITWESVTGVASDFEIERDNSVITMPFGTDTNYKDIDISCNLNYCYKTLANFPGGAQSISAEKCVTAFSSAQPTAISDISVTVNSGTVVADWTMPTLFIPSIYILEGNIENTGFRFLDSLSSNSVSRLDSASCFRVYYLDECGNVSTTSLVGCQILVSFLEGENSLQVFWSNYEGWEMGINSYSLEVYDQNMNLISTSNAGSATTFTLSLSTINEQILNFRVGATPNNVLVTPVFSDFVTYIRQPVINLPKAFSPNQDGLNDNYNVIGKFIDSIVFLVYDRWGKLVFSEKELGSGWDGDINGKPAPSGAYVYHVEVTDFAGRTFKRSGSFVLLR